MNQPDETLASLTDPRARVSPEQLQRLQVYMEKGVRAVYPSLRVTISLRDDVITLDWDAKGLNERHRLLVARLIGILLTNGVRDLKILIETDIHFKPRPKGDHGMLRN